jgi:myosin heavy subunit
VIAFFEQKRQMLDKPEPKGQPFREVEERSLRLLSVLEDELCFLQQLADSPSIQEIVFPTETKMPTNFRQKLIEHCAKMGQFIEQTLPRISLNMAIDSLHSVRRLNCAKVFELVKGGNLAQKVESVMQNATTPESQEMFELFVAEAITASILQRYAVEVNLKLTQARGQLAELKGIADRCDTYRTDLEQSEQRDMQIRSMIGRIFTTSEDTDLVVLIDAVVKYFTTQTSSLPVVASLESRLAQAKRELTESKRAHRSETKALAKAVRETEEGRQDEQNRLKRQLAEKEAVIQDLTHQVADAKKKLEAFNSQVETRAKFDEERIRQLTFTTEMTIAELQGQVSKLEMENSKLTKKCQQRGQIESERDGLLTRVSELERQLKSMAKQLSSKVSAQNAIHEKAIESLKAEHREVYIAKQKISQELEHLRTQQTQFTNEKDSLRLELIVLKQWEIWGRRLIRMKRGIETNLDFDQVRLLLEEDILASNPNREPILKQLSTLKIEKQILLQFQQPIMNQASQRKSSWNSLICCCRFVLKNCQIGPFDDEVVSLPVVLKSSSRVTGSLEVSPILRPKVFLGV